MELERETRARRVAVLMNSVVVYGSEIAKVSLSEAGRGYPPRPSVLNPGVGVVEDDMAGRGSGHDGPHRVWGGERVS